MSALHDLTLLEAGRKLANREVSSAELCQAVFDRIDAVEPSVRAYLHLDRDVAMAQARESDRRRAEGKARGPLDGLPVALKDNLCTGGMRTTCASKLLGNFVPPYSATVVNRLAAAGAVLVGKANMDEFAMGSSVENSGMHMTYNPWDLERVPGGSSGGSAAAVAAGEALFALGSDTGGSIRQPASLCGITGLKPTYGRVSRYGLVAFASSLDQIGPMTRDAADCAAVLQAIAGHDPLDSTSADMPVPDYAAALGGSLRGLRVGVPKEYFGTGLEPAVEKAVRAAIDRLVELGCVAGEISLPHTDYGLSAYYIIAPAEASSNLARYDGVRYGVRAEGGKDLIDLYSRTRAAGFGPEVKRRIMLGTYALSSGYYEAYYGKALKVRTLIKNDFDAAWQRCDLIACPTSPVVAFKVGERVDDPLQMYLADVCTVPVNLAGVPGISIPCGFAPAPGTTGLELPIGLQLIGKPFGEATLLRAAHAFQQATDHHRKRPPLAGAGEVRR